jgi:hypothetical protein
MDKLILIQEDNSQSGHQLEMALANVKQAETMREIAEKKNTKAQFSLQTSRALQRMLPNMNTIREVSLITLFRCITTLNEYH